MFLISFTLLALCQFEICYSMIYRFKFNCGTEDTYVSKILFTTVKTISTGLLGELQVKQVSSAFW